MRIQRSEASKTVSDVNLNEVGKEEVKLNELIKTFKANTSHVAVKQQFKNASKKITLPLPLAKPQAERIKRGVAYEKVTTDVGKWDNIVRANRSAEQLIFPLKEPEYRLEPAEEVVKRFRNKNELEQQIADELGQSGSVLDQEEELTAAEVKAMKAMDLEEAKARHAELRKMRLLLSHKEAKARRQKKIKSKKYHRILKKEKMKKLLKEFEELQKTDPDAAEEKIKEADKLRVLERMTLKHRSTGKWAKQQKIRAKYNPDSRKALKEQMSIGRSLTEKVIPVSTSIIETIPDDDELLNPDDDDGNLLKMYILNSGVDADEVKKAMKDVLAKTKVGKKSQKLQKGQVISKDDTAQESEEEDGFIDETLDRKRTLEDFENLPLVPLMKHKSSAKKSDRIKSAAAANVENKKSVESNFGEETVCLDSLVPDEVTFGDEGIDDDEGDIMTMSQAFADEDIIAEFKEEKEAAIDKEMPKGIDSYLPGWGSWGGKNIKVSKKRQQRFYKPVKAPARKDQSLGNAIISEQKDKKASGHQVSDLPFPYRSINQFHSVIRQPIGNSWNSEISFQKLISPSVITKLGKVISPMDDDDLEIKSEDSKVLHIIKENKKCS